MNRYLLVLAGAGLGGVARAAAATAIMHRFSGKFPLGTFLVNISGCFAIGLVMTILTERTNANPYWRFFLVVGFLGGYTTFSSFAYETLIAVRAADRWIGLLNVLGSVVGGYLAVWLGAAIAAKR